MQRLLFLALAAALVLAAAPVAAAQESGGMQIVLDRQAAGSRTLSGQIRNVPSGVRQVAVTLKVNAGMQQVQVTDQSQEFKFSFSNVSSWQSLSALPVSDSRGRGPMGPMMGLPPGAGTTMTASGQTSQTQATGPGSAMYGPYGAGAGYGAGGYGPYGSGYGSGYGPYGYGYGYCGGTGLAYSYSQPGAYGYAYGATVITGYYLAPYYRFYQPNPNWMYLPYAYYGASPYSYGSGYYGYGC